MKTHKICKKGTGKAIGFEGCNTERDVALYGKSNFKYGLGIDCGCYPQWLYSTEQGSEILSKAIIKGRNLVKKEKKKARLEEKRNLNVKGAMQNADTYFSRYIRLKYSDKGKCTCFTCGTLKPIKECDNGHFMKREHQATRYHENNCRPQCKTCNGDTKHNGKQAEFRVQLANQIGEKTVAKVEALSRTIFKTNTKHFRDISDYYRVKVNEMQKELKVKIW